MDVKLLHGLIDALKVAGCSINEDCIPILYNSLIQLQSENHFDCVYLWGRIVTLSDDYYIAYGHQKNPIKNRTFFYTQNILEWVLMPTHWSIIESDLVCKIKTKFSGNPRFMMTVDNLHKKSRKPQKHSSVSNELLNSEHIENAEENTVQDEHLKQLESLIFDDLISATVEEETMEMEPNVVDYSYSKPMIKEEDRLAITVKMIDNETHIVPRGFFYKLPDENIVKAPYFKGLDYSEIGNEQNFLHINLQYCPHKNTKNKVRSDYNGSIDFLQSIENDVPTGHCWTTQTVSNRYSNVYNLLWQGAVYVQDMNTGVHGFFYNGDGLKNLDLPFMI